MYCQKCGKQNNDGTVFCTNCGEQLKSKQQPIEQTPLRRVSPPKKNNKVGKIILIITVIIIGISIIAQLGRKPTNNDDLLSETRQTEPTDITDTTEAKYSKVESEKKWSSYYDENNIQLTEIDADVLYEYGLNCQGLNVCTVVTIKSVSKGALKANTTGNDSLFFSFVMKFDDANEAVAYVEGDMIQVVGVSEAPSKLGDTININGCHVISSGEQAQIAYTSYKNKADEQKLEIEKVKAESIVAENAEDAINVENYKESCVSVDYADVERNPNNYSGTDIKLSGQVIQVAEGWFNTVTYRVKESSGNIWYVTYSRTENESRIIENDNITIYGKSTGIETYTSILGSTVTVPSLSAEYIDVN